MVAGTIGPSMQSPQPGIYDAAGMQNQKDVTTNIRPLQPTVSAADSPEIADHAISTFNQSMPDFTNAELTEKGKDLLQTATRGTKFALLNPNKFFPKGSELLLELALLLFQLSAASSKRSADGKTLQAEGQKVKADNIENSARTRMYGAVAAGVINMGLGGISASTSMGAVSRKDYAAGTNITQTSAVSKLQIGSSLANTSGESISRFAGSAADSSAATHDSAGTMADAASNTAEGITSTEKTSADTAAQLMAKILDLWQRAMESNQQTLGGISNARV